MGDWSKQLQTALPLRGTSVCCQASRYQKRVQIQRRARNAANRHLNERTPGFSEQMAAIMILTEMEENVNSVRTP